MRGDFASSAEVAFKVGDLLRGVVQVAVGDLAVGGVVLLDIGELGGGGTGMFGQARASASVLSFSWACAAEAARATSLDLSMRAAAPAVTKKATSARDLSSAQIPPARGPCQFSITA